MRNFKRKPECHTLPNFFDISRAWVSVTPDQPPVNYLTATTAKSCTVERETLMKIRKKTNFSSNQEGYRLQVPQKFYQQQK